MNLYVASLLLPIRRQQDWSSGHLTYLPNALYRLGLFHGRRRGRRD